MITLQNTSGQVRCSTFNFSVSHSGKFVGIVSEPMDLVGLDIISDTDFKQEPTLDLLKSLSSHFTYFEWNNISNAGNFNLVLREFCRYWSLKEAYVKALGTGLSFQLNRLEFHHTSWNDIYVQVDRIKLKDWKFWLFDLDEKHWVSIARGVRENFQCEEYSTGFNLPNAAFIFKKIEELVLIKD